MDLRIPVSAASLLRRIVHRGERPVLSMSSSALAQVYGISLLSVTKWVAGRNEPHSPAWYSWLVGLAAQYGGWHFHLDLFTVMSRASPDEMPVELQTEGLQIIDSIRCAPGPDCARIFPHITVDVPTACAVMLHRHYMWSLWRTPDSAWQTVRRPLELGDLQAGAEPEIWLSRSGLVGGVSEVKSESH